MDLLVESITAQKVGGVGAQAEQRAFHSYSDEMATYMVSGSWLVFIIFFSVSEYREVFL